MVTIKLPIFLFCAVLVGRQRAAAALRFSWSNESRENKTQEAGWIDEWGEEERSVTAGDDGIIPPLKSCARKFDSASLPQNRIISSTNEIKSLVFLSLSLIMIE